MTKLILTLSHGQGSVERGFSYNKDMVVENLLEDSLIAHRVVKDFIVNDCEGDASLCRITPGLVQSARVAHSRCKAALAVKQQQREMEEKQKIEDRENVMRLKGSWRPSRMKFLPRKGSSKVQLPNEHSFNCVNYFRK